MPSLLLVDYLQRCRAQYALTEAKPAYTAEESAHLNRIPPRRFAKVVMARTDVELIMVVIPAHFRLAPDLLRCELGVEKVELATERHFKNRFSRCELGAIPPFGHLFGVRALFMASAFDSFADIFCKAGSHGELLRMPFFEFSRLAHLEPIERGAVLQLRTPPRSHLRRLLQLAKDSGDRPSLRRASLIMQS
jgi:Ala-tRNA(Pro) deacylase